MIEFSTAIDLEPHDSTIPRIPVKEGEKWIKHVNCDGARFHILSWGTDGKYCSEPDCIINKRGE